MGRSKIEWCDETWNPIVGCSKCSPGCENCYAEGQAYRIAKCLDGTARAITSPKAADSLAAYASVLKFDTVQGMLPKWNGRTALIQHKLDEPFHWKRARRIFIGSMTDLFHENTVDQWIYNVFGVISKCPQHTFMILTKRPERMRKWARNYASGSRTLSNLQLGVSCSTQADADWMIPELLNTPAAVRVVSLEPLLGAIDLRHYFQPYREWEASRTDPTKGLALDGVIVGGESGPNARPMHPDWARSLRDQCVSAGTPFFFKQWGEWSEVQHGPNNRRVAVYYDGTAIEFTQEAIRAEEERSGLKHKDRNGRLMCRAGKKKAGRMLDGRTWDELPGGAATGKKGEAE